MDTVEEVYEVVRTALCTPYRLETVGYRRGSCSRVENEGGELYKLEVVGKEEEPEGSRNGAGGNEYSGLGHIKWIYKVVRGYTP